MPIYEYRCTKEHTFERVEPITAPAETTCDCGAPAQRVFSLAGIHFKGTGFYTTDYGKSRKAS